MECSIGRLEGCDQETLDSVTEVPGTTLQDLRQMQYTTCGPCSMAVLEGCQQPGQDRDTICRYVLFIQFFVGSQELLIKIGSYLAMDCPLCTVTQESLSQPCNYPRYVMITVDHTVAKYNLGESWFMVTVIYQALRVYKNMQNYHVTSELTNQSIQYDGQLSHFQMVTNQSIQSKGQG